MIIHICMVLYSFQDPSSYIIVLKLLFTLWGGWWNVYFMEYGISVGWCWSHVWGFIARKAAEPGLNSDSLPPSSVYFPVNQRCLSARRSYIAIWGCCVWGTRKLSEHSLPEHRVSQPWCSWHFGLSLLWRNVHGRMFSSILGLCPLDASSTYLHPPPVTMTKNVPRQCQMSPGTQLFLVRNHWPK